MGEVVSLDAYRASAVLRRAAALSPDHPSLHGLRWASPGNPLGHRRVADGIATCGADIFGLAPGSVPLCPECFE